MSETPNAEPRRAPSRRVRHPARLIGFGAVILVLLGGAFAAGQFVRAPYDDALENASAELSVLAAVEDRVVDAGYALPAVQTPASTVDVIVTEAPQQSSSTAPPTATNGDEGAAVAPVESEPLPETERVIVSAAVRAVGDVLSVGNVAGEVSGRPVIAWRSESPLYRDLIPGMTGSDVKALQQVLIDLDYYGVRTSGTFDAGTLDALRRLYRVAGYELPFVQDGVRGLSWREFVALPATDAPIAWVAPVGQLLGAEQPLLRLRTADAALEVRASVLEVDALAAGTEVGVVVDGGAPVLSTVTRLGEFSAGGEDAAAGYPVTIAMPAGLAINGASTITIRAWGSPAPAPAVPAVAVRQDGDGAYVLVPVDEPSEDEAAERRVGIEVVAEAGGWVSFEPNEELPVGTEVLVSR